MGHVCDGTDKCQPLIMAINQDTDISLIPVHAYY